MKREIPILLTVLSGLLITLAFFTSSAEDSPLLWTKAVNTELLEWAQVFFSVAFLLGIANLVRISLKQISNRHPDAPYKAVLLVSLFGFLAIGMAEIHETEMQLPFTDELFDGGIRVSTPAFLLGEHSLVPPNHITLSDGREFDGWVRSRDKSTDELTILTSPDRQEMKVPASDVTATVDRSLKLWVYDRIFIPLQATMFSLLAFYIASAAFRAFRARSTEATLLLLAGAIVMLGQVPLPGVLGDLTLAWQGWLMAFVNGAGQRAIIIGATLGVLATGLRIVLGIERSYLSE
ncbi:MAG: hypothetical protein H6825_06250 [Planctomycetes bacterium]|nr:hypothetical protein [Planctomycetota bacterium]